MTPFELAEPTTLREAIGLLDPDDASVRPIAGGTALLLMMKAGVFRPTRLVSLRNVGALGAIGAANGELTTGARTPLCRLDRSVALRQRPIGAVARPCAGGEPAAAHAPQRPGAQPGDDRRQPRACRPAHGPAAGADRARRARRRDRREGRAHHSGRRAVCRLF